MLTSLFGVLAPLFGIGQRRAVRRDRPAIDRSLLMKDRNQQRDRQDAEDRQRRGDVLSGSADRYVPPRPCSMVDYHREERSQRECEAEKPAGQVGEEETLCVILAATEEAHRQARREGGGNPNDNQHPI